MKLVPWCIAGLVILSFIVLQLLPVRYPGFQLGDRLEWMTYDWRVRRAVAADPPVSDKLGFVGISDDTIALFGEGRLGTNFQFSLYWPRHLYGRVIRELDHQRAAAVGLDVLFAERQYDRPALQTSNGPVESDLFFEQQLRRAGNVVLGATPQLQPHPLFRRSSAALGDISTDPDADGVLRRIRTFRDYRIWHPQIKLEARLNNWDLARADLRSNQVVFPAPRGGTVALPLTDGLFDPGDLNPSRRRAAVVRLQPAFEDVRVWHLGVVLAARALGLDLSKARVEPHRVVLPGTNGQERVLPVDGQGRLLIDWSLRANDPRLTKDSFETLVANDILREKGTNLSSRFQGKLVLIGSTATGNELTDRGATPLEHDTFLTANHWNVVNSILSARFVPPFSRALGVLLVCLLGLVAAGLTCQIRPVRASLGVGLAGVLYLWLSLWIFMQHRFWLPLVMPVGALLVTHFAIRSYQAFFEQTEQRRIKSLFGRVVSPNVVNELLRAKSLSLVGARRKVTVLFSDVRGFTEMTDLTHARAEQEVREQRMPDKEAEAYYDARSGEVLTTINEYLGTVANILIQNQGTLDKYIGDCVMAFWGAPAGSFSDALNCVRAAIAAHRAIYVLNQQRAAENQRIEQENLRRAEAGERPLPLLFLLSLGTGINTGVVTAGLMGSARNIVNYTVFGREVNVAARLEAMAGRDRILIGEATYLELLQDDPALASGCIEMPPLAVKGIRQPIKSFEVPWQTPQQVAPSASATAGLVSSSAEKV